MAMICEKPVAPGIGASLHAVERRDGLAAGAASRGDVVSGQRAGARRDGRRRCRRVRVRVVGVEQVEERAVLPVDMEPKVAQLVQPLLGQVLCLGVRLGDSGRLEHVHEHRQRGHHDDGEQAEGDDDLDQREAVLACGTRSRTSHPDTGGQSFHVHGVDLASNRALDGDGRGDGGAPRVEVDALVAGGQAAAAGRVLVVVSDDALCAL